MNTFALAVILIIASYLCGSLPFGFWIARKFRGKHFDIRNFGSGNIGATNCLRILGKKVGFVVFLLDISKGYVPTIFAKYLFPGYQGDIIGALCLTAAMIGHAYSLYFRIREGKFNQNGKSVATALGGILALRPLIALLALIVWINIVVLTKYVSVASIIAAWISVVLIFSFHAGIVMYILFPIIAIFITVAHRRNIGRLIGHNEPKWGESKVDAIAAFVVHPRDIKDFNQNYILASLPWLKEHRITDKMIKKIIAHGLILEAGEINGIVTDQGEKVKVILLAVPLLPAEIQDEENSSVLENLLTVAALIAKQRGASVIGLGGLLSSYSGGGKKLQDWVDNYHRQYGGLDIIVDNGAAATIAATVIALENESPIKLSEAVVATVGSSGLIGGGLIRYLKDKVKDQIAIARSLTKISDLADVAKLATSDNLSILYEADIDIFATSSPFAIITLENANVLKKDAVVLDVAFPSDFSDDVLKIRPDIKLVRCGLILPPGNPQTRIDFHFGKYNGRFLIPACMTQAIILAVTKEYQHASRSTKISKADIEFYRDQMKECGFKVITSDKSEPVIFGGEGGQE